MPANASSVLGPALTMAVHMDAMVVPGICMLYLLEDGGGAAAAARERPRALPGQQSPPPIIHALHDAHDDRREVRRHPHDVVGRQRRLARIHLLGDLRARRVRAAQRGVDLRERARDGSEARIGASYERVAQGRRNDVVVACAATKQMAGLRGRGPHSPIFYGSRESHAPTKSTMASTGDDVEKAADTR